MGRRKAADFTLRSASVGHVGVKEIGIPVYARFPGVAYRGSVRRFAIDPAEVMGIDISFGVALRTIASWRRHPVPRKRAR